MCFKSLRLATQTLPAAALGALLVLTPALLRAQAPLPLFTDHLVNGFQDWSWGTHNFANPSPVHTGSYSISASLGAWQAISLYHPDFNTALYTNLSFWANGGATGGQRLQVVALFGNTNGPAYSLPALSANSWQQFTVPLSRLGAASVTNLNRINLQLTSSGTAGTFYLADIQLAAKPAPGTVHLNLNAAQPVRAADARWAGLNTAIWDGSFDTPTTIALLKEAGTQILRFPGGSLSDEYHWASNTSGTNTWHWGTSFANFIHVVTNVGARALITVNYGSGTAAEAAAWVRNANLTNRLGFKYWEIGNECYGDWETDTNPCPHDPYTYGVRAAAYMQAMRAADPTIKIGIVSASGENSYSNSCSLNHPAINPRTGQANYGWTPIVLTTLKGLGVTPDFIIEHNYPEWTGQESDPLLLQYSAMWPGEAANLRRQLNDYLGSDSTNVEVLCTENNSNSGAQGRQSTSLVNGLYYADSLGQLMKTELNGFVWWDLRNGTDASGSFDPTLYGWRTTGDLGMIGNLQTKYPPFYAAKLMHWLAPAGSTILNVASDYLLLSGYAARQADGAVSLLVLNKDTATNFNGQIALSGFVPDPLATIRSFGVPQDLAAQTNAAPLAQDIATNEFAAASTNFGFNFPPLSLTLFTFAPAPPRLLVVSSDPEVLQLQGQPEVPYIIQTSADLASWTNFSTNTLSSGVLNFTNIPAGPAPREFWRAVWQP